MVVKMRGRSNELTTQLIQNNEIGPEHKTQEACIELENCILDSKEVKGEKETTNLGIKTIDLAYYFCNENTVFSTPEEREKSFDVLIRTIEAFKNNGFIISRLLYALRIRDPDAMDQKGFEYGKDQEFIKKCISRINDLLTRRVITPLAREDYEHRLMNIAQELGKQLRASELKASRFGRPVGSPGIREDIVFPRRKRKV